MGIFKKIGKGIKKVFKKIGKGIKKVFRKIGDLGILGTIALSFILGPAAGFITGKLGTAASALMTKGAVAKGMGHVITAATKVASVPGNVFKTVTDGVMGFVQQVGGEVLNKMGFRGAAAQSSANVSKAFRGWAEGAAESARKNLIDPFTMSNKDYAEQLIAQSQPAAKDALKEVELKPEATLDPDKVQVKGPETLDKTGETISVADSSKPPTTDAGANIQKAAEKTTVDVDQSLLDSKGTDSPYRYSSDQRDLINPFETVDSKTGMPIETDTLSSYDRNKDGIVSKGERQFAERYPRGEQRPTLDITTAEGQAKALANIRESGVFDAVNESFAQNVKDFLNPREWLDKFKDPEWRAGAGDEVMEAARKSTGKVFETAMVQYALGGGQGVDLPKTGTPVYGQAQFLENAYTQAGYNYGGTPANYYVGQAYQNMQPSPYGDVLSMGLRPVGRIA